MSFEAAKSRYPLPPEQYRRYIHSGIQPPLAPEGIRTDLLVGAERLALKTPTTGDGSFVLWYKGCEGVVASYVTTDSDLMVVQLQGANSRKSYRVATGMDTNRLVADETLAIAQLPEADITRVTMPHPSDIAGVSESATLEQAVTRYQAFAVLAFLRWSQEEHLFVRDII